jgi:hypothetical protein
MKRVAENKDKCFVCNVLSSLSLCLSQGIFMLDNFMINIKCKKTQGLKNVYILLLTFVYTSVAVSNNKRIPIGFNLCSINTVSSPYFIEYTCCAVCCIAIVMPKKDFNKAYTIRKGRCSHGLGNGFGLRNLV